MQYGPFNFTDFRSDPRFVGVFSRVRSRPSWIWKLASLAAAVVIIVPILALIVAAVGTFLLMFLVLSLLHAAGRGLETFFGHISGRDRQGRRNVRVVREN